MLNNKTKAILILGITLLLSSAGAADRISGEYLEIGVNAQVSTDSASIGITDSVDNNLRTSGLDDDAIKEKDSPVMVYTYNSVGFFGRGRAAYKIDDKQIISEGDDISSIVGGELTDSHFTSDTPGRLSNRELNGVKVEDYSNDGNAADYSTNAIHYVGYDDLRFKPKGEIFVEEKNFYLCDEDGQWHLKEIKKGETYFHCKNNEWGEINAPKKGDEGGESLEIETYSVPIIFKKNGNSVDMSTLEGINPYGNEREEGEVFEDAYTFGLNEGNLETLENELNLGENDRTVDLEYSSIVGPNGEVKLPDVDTGDEGEDGDGGDGGDNGEPVFKFEDELGEKEISMDEDLTLEKTIKNIGEADGETTVNAEFYEDWPDDEKEPLKEKEENVDVSQGSSSTVSFELGTSELGDLELNGHYSVMISTEDNSQTADVNFLSAYPKNDVKFDFKNVENLLHAYEPIDAEDVEDSTSNLEDGEDQDFKVEVNEESENLGDVTRFEVFLNELKNSDGADYSRRGAGGNTDVTEWVDKQETGDDYNWDITFNWGQEIDEAIKPRDGKIDTGKYEIGIKAIEEDAIEVGGTEYDGELGRETQPFMINGSHDFIDLQPRDDYDMPEEIDGSKLEINNLELDNTGSEIGVDVRLEGEVVGGAESKTISYNIYSGVKTIGAGEDGTFDFTYNVESMYNNQHLCDDVGELYIDVVSRPDAPLGEANWGSDSRIEKSYSRPQKNETEFGFPEGEDECPDGDGGDGGDGPDDGGDGGDGGDGPDDGGDGGGGSGTDLAIITNSVPDEIVHPGDNIGSEVEVQNVGDEGGEFEAFIREKDSGDILSETQTETVTAGQTFSGIELEVSEVEEPVKANYVINGNSAGDSFVVGPEDFEIENEIKNWNDLHNMRYDLDGEYELANDLDEDTDGYDEYASPEANNGKGWSPIGDESDPFSGKLESKGYAHKGYKISDLFIDRPDENYVGLFGHSTGSIDSITIENASITGWGAVGAVSGGLESEGLPEDSLSESEHYISGVEVRESEIKGETMVGGVLGVLQPFKTPLASLQFSSSVKNDIKADRAAGGAVGRIEGNNDGGYYGEVPTARVKGVTSEQNQIETEEGFNENAPAKAGGIVGEIVYKRSLLEDSESTDNTILYKNEDKSEDVCVYGFINIPLADTDLPHGVNLESEIVYNENTCNEENEDEVGEIVYTSGNYNREEQVFELDFDVKIQAEGNYKVQTQGPVDFEKDIQEERTHNYHKTTDENGTAEITLIKDEETIDSATVKLQPETGLYEKTDEEIVGNHIEILREYDEDDNGKIGVFEAQSAFNDFEEGDISKTESEAVAETFNRELNFEQVYENIKSGDEEKRQGQTTLQINPQNENEIKGGWKIIKTGKQLNTTKIADQCGKKSKLYKSREEDGKLRIHNVRNGGNISAGKYFLYAKKSCQFEYYKDTLQVNKDLTPGFQLLKTGGPVEIPESCGSNLKAFKPDEKLRLRISGYSETGDNLLNGKYFVYTNRECTLESVQNN